MASTDEIKRAREQVSALVKEIEDLAAATPPPDQFFPAFLERLLIVLGAPGGAVWLRNGSGQIGCACELNLAPLGVMSTQNGQRINERFVGEVLETGEARVRAQDEGDPTPTPHVYLMAALHRGKECVGAVEVVQRIDSAREARPGYLQFMEQMCGHASRYLQDLEGAKTQQSPEEFWNQFEQFVLRLQRTLDINEIATTAANDIRQFIQCDRVCVAVYRFNKTDINAVSGTDTVNRRANLIRALRTLVDRVIATGEPLRYSGQLQNLAPQIEAPLADYISESGARLIHILPFFEPAPLIKPSRETEDAFKPVTKYKPIGALVIEQLAEGRLKPGVSARVDLAARHVAAALNSAIIHNRLFLLPVWRTLGHAAERVRGRLLLKIVAGLVALAVATLALIFVPWDYKVEAKGRLMPVKQADVFAPWDARVDRIHVKSGDKVQEGQLLLQLKSEDLEAKLLTAQNEYSELLKQISTYQAELDEANRRAERDKATELQGKLALARTQLSGAQAQSQILQRQLDQLEVKSPVDGTITTFQIEQLLANRPVQRGEVLLEVMRENGPWHLELEIPDNRMGHILNRTAILGKDELPLQFMLATSTEVTYTGTINVAAAATRTALTQETGSVVEANGEIAPADFVRLTPGRRVGAELTAWINCGKKPLGYVLFGDVIEFLEKRSIFW